MGALVVLEVTDYDKWMVNEYQGKYSVCDAWKNRDGEWQPSFCQIKNGEYTIPKGLGGRFDSIKELRSMLVLLIKKIDEYDAGSGPVTPEDNTGDGDDIPF